MWLRKSVFALSLTIFYVANCSNQPEVRTLLGSVKGQYIKTINNRQIASFEGIPYAKPPTGKHRFKAPVAAGLWYGVLNATRAPPHCLQYNYYSASPTLSGSEDCLYLNVYTPQLPSKYKQNKPLDVIAFIHGGGFTIGESKMHGPALLLDRDLVLVTFNYRLGPLGFLSTGDDVVPGNNGLKDQVLALKWIQQNIAAFGGNPDSVTLGGLSAGGASCHFHLLSPLSKGLFKGAICMSGVALNPWALAENSNEKAKLVANELGCPTNESALMIKCLRNRPADHIVHLTQKLLYWRSFPSIIFAPVVEPVGPNAFISEHPIDIIKNKAATDVPTIVSHTSDEGLILGAEIITNPSLMSELLNRWEELAPHLLDYNYTAPNNATSQISQNIKEYYKINHNSELGKNLIKLLGDRTFLAGISKLAKLSTLYSSPMYIYKFSYRGQFSLTQAITQEDLGVCHADDIFYTIGHYVGHTLNIGREKDLEVSKDMMDVWVSFAANGTLGENWQPVNKQLPKITFTDILGPKDFKLTFVDQLGEENFWDSLGLNENIETLRVSRDEL